MTTRSTKRAAIYARVSTFEQTAENQLVELRRYVEARGWTSQEFVEEGVSGAKDRRLHGEAGRGIGALALEMPSALRAVPVYPVHAPMKCLVQ